MMEIRLAKLYRFLGEEDNRLQVRILPNHADVPKDLAKEVLPCFPTFERGRIINGKSEVDSSYSEADSVLVITNENFSIGWVLCKANPPVNTQPYVAKDQDNCLYSQIQNLINGQDFKESFPIENVEVVSYTEARKGAEAATSFELLNLVTGARLFGCSSGTTVLISAEHVCIRTGTPGMTSAHSSINITPDTIEISSTGAVVIDAKGGIVTGNSGSSIVSTSSTGLQDIGGTKYKGESRIFS